MFKKIAKKKCCICIIEKKAVPLQSHLEESCLSGRKSRTRNAVYAQAYRGFESPTFRENEPTRNYISTL